MKNRNIYIWILGLVLVGIGSFVLGQHFSHQATQTASLISAPSIPNIPTPTGWYSWGGQHYPDDPKATTDIANILTFGDQPMNNTGNVTTTLITINAQAITAQGIPTSTDAKWLNLRSVLDSGNSQTSTQLWDIVDNKLVLGEVSLNPSGRYMLTYYLIYGGDEYVFHLIPSPFLPSLAQYDQTNIINSPDAQVLREIVKEVAGQI